MSFLLTRNLGLQPIVPFNTRSLQNFSDILDLWALGVFPPQDVAKLVSKSVFTSSDVDPDR